MTVFSNRIRGRWALLLVIGVLGGCVKSDVSAVSKEAFVVDVRTPNEYRDWHYPGAVNIPLQELETRLDEFGDRGREIIVYCRSGNRSATAKKRLISLGFTKVLNGGSKWHMEGLAPEIRARE